MHMDIETERKESDHRWNKHRENDEKNVKNKVNNEWLVRNAKIRK